MTIQDLEAKLKQMDAAVDAKAKAEWEALKAHILHLFKKDEQKAETAAGAELVKEGDKLEGK